MDIRTDAFYQLTASRNRSADCRVKFNAKSIGYGAGVAAGVLAENPTHEVKVFEHLDLTEGDVVKVDWIDGHHTFRVVRNGASPRPYGQVLYCTEIQSEVPV